MKLRINISHKIIQKSVNLFVVGLFLLPIYIDLMGTLSRVLGFSTKITTYLYYGILWILLLVSIPKIIRALTNAVLIGILVVTMFIVGQYLAFPDNTIYIFPKSLDEVITLSPTTLVTVIPYIFIGLAITDIEGLAEYMHTGSRIGVVLGALSYLLAIFFDYDIHYDDMANAYALCSVICVLITSYQKKDIYFLILGAFSLILAGTRGPILCVIIAVLLRVLLLERTSTRKTFLIIAGVCVIFLILQTDFLVEILNFVEYGFEMLGVDDLRIVEYFRRDMIADASGRDGISNVILEGIAQRPMLGYGPGGDRIVRNSNSYAHNLVLEMWVSYGVVVGSLIIAWMGYWLFKSIFSKGKALGAISAALFSCIAVKLLLSSSYLYSKELFVFLGVCIAGCRILKNNFSQIKRETI